MQDAGHLLGHGLWYGLRAGEHLANIGCSAVGIHIGWQVWQAGKRAVLVLLLFNQRTPDKALHGWRPAGIGHCLAFGAPQQQCVCAHQRQRLCHGHGVLRMGVAGDQQVPSLHRIHQFDQAVCGVAQAHHPPNIQQALQTAMQQ
jgi:hypothetical protein